MGTGTDRSPRYTFSVLVTNGWRRLDHNTSAGGQLPAPASQVLGPWGVGAGFCWGVSFQVTSQSPQMVPGVGTPPRCVGRGGVLDNLMFSTLTPFFVFKVGVGAAAKSGYWVGPFSLPPTPPPRPILPSLLPVLWLVSGGGKLFCRAL